MIGAPHHVAKALEVGMDIVCAQGTEAGGHTGPIATMPLVPQIVDACRGHKSFFGGDVLVVAAGGIYDGRGLAASLALGAAGVWVGARVMRTPYLEGWEARPKEVAELTAKGKVPYKID